MCHEKMAFFCCHVVKFHHKNIFLKKTTTTMLVVVGTLNALKLTKQAIFDMGNLKFLEILILLLVTSNVG
jgi:hypothetical protein